MSTEGQEGFCCTSRAFDAEEACATLQRAKAEGSARFQAGDLKGALAQYEQALDVMEGVAEDSWPPSVRQLTVALRGNAAHVLLKMGADDASESESSAARALVHADRVLSVDPHNVKARFRRGCAHKLARSWDAAAQDFLRVLEAEPHNDAVRRELDDVRAKLLSQQGEVAPSEIERCNAEGMRLFQAQQYFEAYQRWKEAVDLLESTFLLDDAPSEKHRRLMLSMCNNSAQALLRCPEVEGASTHRARVMAQKALSIDPNNVKALFRRGCAYANARSCDLARQDFEAVLVAEPENESAARELARLDDSTDRNGPGEDWRQDPVTTVRLAQQEAERFRKEVLVLADGHGCVTEWCQRFNKIQVQVAQWVKHQLSDSDMAADLVEAWGPVFQQMDQEQRENFLNAYDFVEEARERFGADLQQLQETPVAAAPSEQKDAPEEDAQRAATPQRDPNAIPN